MDATEEPEVDESDPGFDELCAHAANRMSSIKSGNPPNLRPEGDDDYRIIVNGLEIRSYERGGRLVVDPLSGVKAMLQAALYASISASHAFQKEDHVEKCWAWTRVFPSDHAFRALFDYLKNRSTALRKYVIFSGLDRSDGRADKYAIRQGYPFERTMGQALATGVNAGYRPPAQAEVIPVFNAFRDARAMHPAPTIISIIKWACTRNDTDAESFLVCQRMRCIEYAMERVWGMVDIANDVANGYDGLMYILPFGDSPTDGYTGAMMPSELRAMEALVSARTQGRYPIRTWPRVTVTTDDEGKWVIDPDLPDRYTNASEEFVKRLEECKSKNGGGSEWDVYSAIASDPFCPAYGALMRNDVADKDLQNAATVQLVLALVIGFQHAWIDPVNNVHMHEPLVILQMWGSGKFTEKGSDAPRPMHEILLDVTPVAKLDGGDRQTRVVIARMLEMHGWDTYGMETRMRLHCATHGIRQVKGVPQGTLTPQMGTELPALVTAWVTSEEKNGRIGNISGVSSILKHETNLAIGVPVVHRHRVAPSSLVAPREQPDTRNASSTPGRDAGSGAPVPSSRSWVALQEREGPQHSPDAHQVVDVGKPNVSDSSALVQPGSADWAEFVESLNEFTDAILHPPSPRRMFGASKPSVAGSSTFAGSSAVDRSRLLRLERDAAAYAASCARARKEADAAREYKEMQQLGQELRTDWTNEATEAHLIGSAKSAKRARDTWNTARLRRKNRYSFVFRRVHMVSTKA